MFSPGEEIVNWFDLRWRQNSATTVEHETEWSCYSLPIFLACRALHHPYPRAFCTLPSFARIKRPRWLPVGLNDRHLRSNGKIGDCEQSTVNMMYCAFPLRLLVFFWRDPSWCQSHNSSGSPVAFSQASAGELTRAFPLAFPSEFSGVFLASSVISQCDSGFSVLYRKAPFEYHLEKRYPFCIPSIEKNILLSHAWEHCRNL